MSTATLLELARKLLESPIVMRVEFLGTKVRAYLPHEYFLDIYYNVTLGKYSYTIIKHGLRVIGWDNADHHEYVKSHPHHFHNLRGKVTKSQMKGEPLKDLDTVLKEAQRILKL